MSSDLIGPGAFSEDPRAPRRAGRDIVPRAAHQEAGRDTQWGAPLPNCYTQPLGCDTFGFENLDRDDQWSMSITRKRGGRAPLDEKGSTPVPTRFGQGDLARIDKAWAAFGSADRSTFIRRAALDKADEVLNTEANTRAANQRAEAVARRNETAVLAAVEGELFAAVAELIGRRTPYVWGGGSITGPSLGQGWDDASEESRRNAETVGFDAGSLEQYLIFRAFQIEIPRTPQDQFRFGQPATEPQAGDLVFFEEYMTGGVPDYVATYLGRGCIAEARRPGELICISALPATGVHLRRAL
jgi:cell wall-associated NlpC family hydrolase